jgi:hypothetical protein
MMSRAKKNLFIFAVLVILLFALYYHSPYFVYGWPEKFKEKISPDGRYKIEYYIPRYSLYGHSFDRDSFFVKIYDLKEGKLIVTSAVHNMNDITPMNWPNDCSPDISIGYDMVFKVR